MRRDTPCPHCTRIARTRNWHDPEILPFIVAFKYSAIMDSRTCSFCRRLDGRLFHPRSPYLVLLAPPIHPRCRSILSSVMIGSTVLPENFISDAECEELLLRIKPRWRRWWQRCYKR